MRFKLKVPGRSVDTMRPRGHRFSHGLSTRSTHQMHRYVCVYIWFIRFMYACLYLCIYLCTYECCMYLWVFAYMYILMCACRQHILYHLTIAIKSSSRCIQSVDFLADYFRNEVWPDPVGALTDDGVCVTIAHRRSSWKPHTLYHIYTYSLFYFFFFFTFFFTLLSLSVESYLFSGWLFSSWFF